MSHKANEPKMKSEKDILSEIGHKSGMTVPDGYFDNFISEMAQRLPERDITPKIMPRTRWQKIRPYVYLAAMFLGIWCMMKMFSLMSPSDTGLSIDTNSILANALDNEVFMNDYYMEEINDYDVLEDMYSEGISTEELTR